MGLNALFMGIWDREVIVEHLPYLLPFGRCIGRCLANTSLCETLMGRAFEDIIGRWGGVFLDLFENGKNELRARDPRAPGS